jgi:phthalate 4,5-dioxygenase
MLSREDNEILCRVGPGTPMGKLVREYWIPTLSSKELPEPDGAPLRVRLLGEDLLAFRTTSGKIGLIQERCLHRGASLFFGRNEKEGIRCVYHGWKFDIAGRCTDLPTDPADSDFKCKLRAKAYPCVERNGVVWAYLGSRPEPPALPEIEPNMGSLGAEAVVTKTMTECNWFQAMEGDLDPGHLPFLHLGLLEAEALQHGTFEHYMVRERQTSYEIAECEAGVRYAAPRSIEDDKVFWRVGQYLLPFYSLLPAGILGQASIVRCWVPLDDENTMVWNIVVPRTMGGAVASDRAQKASSEQGYFESRKKELEQYLPDTSDGLGRFRLARNMSNDFLIDRKLQKTVSYTGIEGIWAQDACVTQSMGRIVDRTQEHLGASDVMVIQSRRRLLRAAKALRDSGTVPPGVDNPGAYATRGGSIILPKDAGIWDATKDLLAKREPKSG